jgi:hypothetical protein
VGGLKEISIATARIVLGLIILIEGLIVVDLIIYISTTGSTFSEKVAAAYDRSFDQSYTQTYLAGYQEAYGEAYFKGYGKGYEIGLENSSIAETTTRVKLHNPTYKELREFLTADETNSNEFIRGEYVCFQFATELNNKAEANGIRAAYVRLRFEEWAHAVVAFETVDRGLVFIEPQSDGDVELVIGEAYPWLSAGAKRTRKYSDAILEIQIIW